MKNCFKDDMPQKNCFMPLKSPPRWPKRPPRRSKIFPGLHQDDLRRPRPPPRQPQGAPKTAQDAPKTSPRRLQDAPKTTKHHPRRPKMIPKTRQDASKTHQDDRKLIGILGYFQCSRAADPLPRLFQAASRCTKIDWNSL